MIHKQLKLSDSDLPKDAYQAFITATASIRKIQRHYFSHYVNKLDRDDSESEALLEGLRFIKNKLKEDTNSHKWPQNEWHKHIIRRFQNAILEYSKYVYLPVVIPRPLRFSLKKYMEALRIINKYVKSIKDAAHSDLYYVLCIEGCSPLSKKCKICEFGYSECPISEVSGKDRKELFAVLRGPRKSLEFYAKWYRKTFEEWIRALELLRMYSVSSNVPDIPVNYDFDGSADLRKMQSRLNALHPDLYDIYCLSMEDLDLNHLESDLVMKTPTGWSNKRIKEQYNLSTQQYRELLLAGDTVLNTLRLNEGLHRVFRDIQKESFS
jgi:hypothetical protein